ncbi:MAG: putative sporulation protein YtxC [Clostridia bacterium]|nr:putative sporulation protein YtxC [Clostridia bacterium]
MTDRITLGLCGDINFISARLLNYPECVFPISVSAPETEDSVTYISLEPSDDVRMLDRYVNVIAEYIIDRYEIRLLKRILAENFDHLSVVAKREVLKSVECLADDPELGYQARKQTVVLSVYDYLKEDSTMLVDGFVAFRLKDYEALLKKLAEALVERYEAHREYEEFISLLKYFVGIQKDRPAMAHVLVVKEGGYVILDAEGKDITAPCFADFLEGEVLLTEEAYDDLLISVLITLAPEKITVHNKQFIRNDELFATIFRVFEGNVMYCGECEFCK